ncbi:MAG: LPXTG cell wall anchor domain-containing protein [Planctomycetota bacterium]
MAEQDPSTDRESRLEPRIAELRDEVRGLGEEIRLLRKDLRAAGNVHPALLFLSVATLGFVLALCLNSGFHWLVSLGLSLAASLLVFFLFRRKQKPAS